MGKLIKGENDLLTWCNNNGEFGQQLISEWTGEREDTGEIKCIDTVSRGDNHKFIWLCKECGNTWSAKVLHRTSCKSQCPFCSKNRRSEAVKKCKLKTGVNDLLTWCKKNGNFGQRILNEFDYERNNDTPQNIISGSHTKLWWKCTQCGHYWQAKAIDRTKDRTGCPKCHYLKQGENDLLTWCKKNGNFGQQLIQQWEGKCSDDSNHYALNSVAQHTSKKFIWKCNKGHEWEASVSNRTHNRTACPYCNNKSTSYPEQFIFRALKQIYPKTISRGKFKDMEYDIIVPEEETYIEYSGSTWHLDKIERDQIKADICEANNKRFIQIYANYYYNDITDETVETVEDNLIIYNVNHKNHNKQLIRILQHILKLLNHSIEEIDIEKAQTEAFNFMHNIDNTEDTQDRSTIDTFDFDIK